MDQGLIHPVILSGGSGTRLWPLSRPTLPKQLQALTGDLSLIGETARRVGDAKRFTAPLVICNNEQRFLVAEALRDAGGMSAQLVLEPKGRNTAPAAAVAALLVAADAPQGVILLLPSDHHIEDLLSFSAAIELAAAAAARGHLVTFGLKPERAETGYGYIEQGAPLAGLVGVSSVPRFIEKPDLKAAEDYLAAGKYLWNGGIFCFRADVMIEEMRCHCPDILAGSEKALKAAKADLDFLRLDEESFSATPTDSLDYAVMEKTDKAAVVAIDMGWSDLGAWDALWQIATPDKDGNVLRGAAVASESHGSYLRSEGPLVAVLGVEDLVVVATKDAVLVCPKDRAQDVKSLVAKLEAKGHREARHHPLVRRPWGSYESLDSGPGFQVKRLTIKPGASISLQRHQKRAEHWVVVAGQAEVTLNDKLFALAVNQSTYIPIGAMHRLKNSGTEPLHIIEVQSGSYLGEDDIERFEDNYGRA